MAFFIRQSREINYSLKSVSEEFVLRSIKGSPLLKPFLIGRFCRFEILTHAENKFSPKSFAQKGYLDVSEISAVNFMVRRR